MPAQLPIPVNPELVAWARRESGYEIERVAKRLGVKAERVEAWERGELQPTARQMGLLARFLQRPLSTFFLPRPPNLPALAAEYRRLPGVEPGKESPELRLALRQMLIRRDNALNLMGELGTPVPRFRLRAHLSESPADVGARLRAALGVSTEEQLGWPSEWAAWPAWRAAVEQAGVLVFVFSRVALDEARGLALLRHPLAAVGVNGKEIPEGKIFTLLHEVVHLMLASGHEEAPALEEKRSPAEWLSVERFAEVAASHAIVPEPTLRSQVTALGLRPEWTVSSVRRLARRFRITPLATATRLRESGFMSWKTYRDWREEWDIHVAGLPPRRGGIATPAEKALNSAGRPFAQLVIEALSANRITSADAARYLNLGFDHFEALRADLVGAEAGGSSAA